MGKHAHHPRRRNASDATGGMMLSCLNHQFIRGTHATSDTAKDLRQGHFVGIKSPHQVRLEGDLKMPL